MVVEISTHTADDDKIVSTEPICEINEEIQTDVETVELAEEGDDQVLLATLARLTEIQGTVTAAASRKGEAGQWYVECSVDGRKQRLMVDTGCTITMLDVQVYREWYGGSLEGLNQTGRAYTGVTGSDLKIYGWREMTIELAGVQRSCKVIVAGMALSGILGMDALIRMGCKLDFATGEMQIQGTLVELEGRAVPGLHQLVTLEEMVVGSCSERIVQLGVQSTVEEEVPSEGEVIPLEGGPVILGRALVRVRNRKVYTSLLNPCEDVRVVPVGTVVAVLEEVLEVVEMPEGKLSGGSQRKTNHQKLLGRVTRPQLGYTKIKYGENHLLRNQRTTKGRKIPTK